MDYDISESVSQRGSGEETAENRRIHEVTDELYRRCQLYEAQLRDSQDDVNHLDVEQRVAELYAKENGFDGRTIMPILKQRLIKDAVPATSIEIETYMAAIGFSKQNDEGRYANDEYVVWDLVPRNVLRDKDGDIYVVDAEIVDWG